MSLLKDWRDETEGYAFTAKLSDFFSPKVWSRLHTWRKQRADRGWSDRDTWAAGEHIAQMTAEMLQHLNDDTYVDWPEWFNMNVQENEGYTSLQSVIDDINRYLAFTRTSWGDDLTCEETSVEDEGPLHSQWLDKSGRKVSHKKVTEIMLKHHNKENELYKKATEAMQFFGRHFASFWD